MFPRGGGRQANNGLLPRPPKPQHHHRQAEAPLGNNSSLRVQAPPLRQYDWIQRPPTPPDRWFGKPPTMPEAAPNTAYVAKRRKRPSEDHDQQHASSNKQQRLDAPPLLPPKGKPLLPTPPPPRQNHQHHHHHPPPRDVAAGSSSQDHRTSPVPYHPSPPPQPPMSPQVPALPRSHSLLYPYATDKLSSQMVEVYESCHQQLSDLQKKEVCRTWLQADINRLFPEGRLYLTGSSMSGLACRSSDADLCLVLDSWEPPERGFLGILKNARKRWKQMGDAQRPDAITVLNALLKLFHTLPYLQSTHLIRAKVPILRFIERDSGVEFDLNVNNTVGIRNTFLLRSYGEADVRVKPMILVIKKWARHHHINDASKGTLSSYTLVLMVISYLQILHKPVLPSLQTDFPECFHPAMEIDMVPHGPRHIPAYMSKNKSTLGELLLGFLEHYATVFKWDKQVISVREAHRLTKDRANAREFISVEEPFERNNVARAVHEKVKFDAIRAQFSQSYQRLSQKKDLNSILPIRDTINYELSGK